MNLADGKIIDTSACNHIVNTLEQRIVSTLGKRPLNPEMVIKACGQLANALEDHVCLKTMEIFGINKNLGKNYISQFRQMFHEQNLRNRLRKELGDNYHSAMSHVPFSLERGITEKIMPLGVLLYIAAGNAEGLPAFSVLEGLLTGNINILKLPSFESGISVWLLQELVKIEPALKEYVYVFDFSSSDSEQIRKLMDVANAVVIWGGDETIAALRRMVKPNTKLIEWGHKMSFAYITPQGFKEDSLNGLACHITETDQLLCSSCQGIYIDTDDAATLNEFCEKFLPVLENAFMEHAKDFGIGIKSQIALQVYSAQLETMYNNSQVFMGENCSLIVNTDNRLEPSIRYGNAWVKPLPRQNLLTVLRRYKDYLHTAGLICSGSERTEVTELLLKTGIVQVRSCESMSWTYCGSPHDGEYPLRRYTKVVSCSSQI